MSPSWVLSCFLLPGRLLSLLALTWSFIARVVFSADIPTGQRHPLWSPPGRRLRRRSMNATAATASSLSPQGEAVWLSSSQGGGLSASISTTWELARNADSQGPAGGFNKLPDDSEAHSSVKATELADSPKGKKSGRLSRRSKALLHRLSSDNSDREGRSNIQKLCFYGKTIVLGIYCTLHTVNLRPYLRCDCMCQIHGVHVL